jgi:hypothetical protein
MRIRRISMPKHVVLPVVGAVSALALLAAPGSLAKDGPRIIETGPCSAASDWKLKVKPEDRGLEVEFEVDQNVNGDRWRVLLRRNGVKFADVVRKTKPPSGSFEVRRVVANKSGEDRFRARAKNSRTGEVCKGRAVFPA